MLKFAFLIHVPGAEPKTYGKALKTQESYSIVAGVDGLAGAKDYAAKLAEKGFDIINLSGNYDEECMEEIREAIAAATDRPVKLRYAQYTINEVARLNLLHSYRKYGVIIVMRGVEKPREILLRHAERDTRVIFARDMRQAREAARILVKKRVDYIELCSWFDRLRMDTILDAIEYAVPVGTCGDLDMMELE